MFGMEYCLACIVVSTLLQITWGVTLR